MQKVNSPQGKWRSVVFLLTALLIVAADQLSKMWISSNLAVGQSLPETGFFRLTHVHNTGAAFGSFQDQLFILTIVSLVAIAVLLLCALLIYRRSPLLDNRLSKLALGLVLGGTVGNFIDRLCLGYVTDFICVGTWWPSFNIADSAIVVGVIIFACSLLPLARAGGS